MALGHMALEPYMLPHQMSVGAKGTPREVHGVNAPEQQWRVPPSPKIPRNNSAHVFLWSHSYGTIPLCPSHTRILCPYSVFEYISIPFRTFVCYEELDECLKPLNTLNLLLKSLIEHTIQNTLDYFLRLM